MNSFGASKQDRAAGSSVDSLAYRLDPVRQTGREHLVSVMTASLPGHIAALVAKVQLAGPDRSHGVVLGPPAVLSALCAFLGFKNACSKGSVYLTPAKLRRLGLSER